MNLKRLTALALCALGISAFGATEIQEALDCTDLEFITGGDADWEVQSDVVHTGTSALQSGWIDDGELTYVEMTVPGAGLLEFQWKVSSEPNWGELSVYVDDELVERISGEQGWLPKVVNVAGAGEHTVQWVYEKYGSSWSGLDCACTLLIGIPPNAKSKTVGVYGYVRCALTVDGDGMVTAVRPEQEFLPFGYFAEQE